MADFMNAIGDTLARLDARNAFDILLIAAIFYWMLMLIRGTTAMTLPRGAALRAWAGRPLYDETIAAVSDAALRLAERRHGALMVLERDTGLQDYIDTGVRVDAAPSAELLEGIFYPNSPLHDGAVILRQDRVMAAACTLPLSENSRAGHVGTRHRAALGISERTDAVSVVVSEQTGDISVASDGRLVSRL